MCHIWTHNLCSIVCYYVQYCVLSINYTQQLSPSDQCVLSEWGDWSACDNNIKSRHRQMLSGNKCPSPELMDSIPCSWDGPLSKLLDLLEHCPRDRNPENATYSPFFLENSQMKKNLLNVLDVWWSTFCKVFKRNENNS